MRFSLVAAGLALGLCSAAMAQSDSCFTPTPISGFGTFPFDTNAAFTDGPSETACSFFGNSQIFNDVWYCWTASASGLVRARTCALSTLDTKLAVYAFCDCPDGSVGPLACSDDNCGAQSEVSWTASAGSTYMLRLGSYNEDQTGTGSLEIGAAPPPGTVAGPLTNPANGHTYYLLTPSTWTVAEANAVALGGHLVTVNDQAENDYVQNELAGFGGVDRRVWIGFNDVNSEGTFTWISGDASAYTNWNGGEPNNTNGLEHYTELFRSSGTWNDNTNNPPFQVFGVVEIGATAPPCGSADFDCDGDTGTDADIETFFACLAGNCPPAPCTSTADFDGDGDTGTDADIEAFFRVLAGGTC